VRGWVSAGLQAVVDCLLDERCHACGGGCDDAAWTPPAVIRTGSLSLSTRLLCAACARGLSPLSSPVFVQHAPGVAPIAVHAAFLTDNAVLALTHLLKFSRRERVAPWMAGLMQTALCHALAADNAGALLVPVPMDRAALRRRGFNQAARIALQLGSVSGVAVARHALHKVRATRPQSSLGRLERLQNLDGAIAPGRDRVAGRHVILVDDLVTTGATARVCERVLRANGARLVTVVCFGYRP